MSALTQHGLSMGERRFSGHGLSLRLLAILSLVLLALSAGCGYNPTSSGEAAALAVVSGAGQRGAAGDTLSAPLVVLLTDSRGAHLRTGVRISRSS